MADGAPAVEGSMGGGKRSAWMSHVKKTMKANKGKSLMQVLKMAKKTYKKTAKRGGGIAAGALPLGGQDGGRRRTRKAKKSRKGGKLY